MKIEVTCYRCGNRASAYVEPDERARYAKAMEVVRDVDDYCLKFRSYSFEAKKAVAALRALLDDFDRERQR